MIHSPALDQIIGEEFHATSNCPRPAISAHLIIRDAKYISYDLFVIFEATATGNYKAALSWYNNGDEENYESPVPGPTLKFQI